MLYFSLGTEFRSIKNKVCSLRSTKKIKEWPHVTICLTTLSLHLTIMEISIKTTLRFHLTPVRMAMKKNTKEEQHIFSRIANATQDVGGKELFYTVAESVN